MIPFAFVTISDAPAFDTEIEGNLLVGIRLTVFGTPADESGEFLVSVPQTSTREQIKELCNTAIVDYMISKGVIDFTEDSIISEGTLVG